MPTAIQRHYMSLLYYYVHIIQSIFMCAVKKSNHAPYVGSGRHLLYLWNSLYSNTPLEEVTLHYCALAAFASLCDSVSLSNELLSLKWLGEYICIHQCCCSVY